MNTRRTALAALTLPLALTFAACGEDDGEDRSTDTAAPAAAPTSASPTSASPSGTTSSAPASTPATTDDDALLAAARTAAGAVPGGTLLSLDLEAAGWEAEVADGDAAAFDLAVSADGAAVTREPVEDRDDADDASEDLAERRDLVAGATLDAAAAVEAVRSAGTTGTIAGLDLDLSAGTVVWEVQLGEDTATEQTVTVDAGSGEVLRTEQDD